MVSAEMEHQHRESVIHSMSWNYRPTKLPHLTLRPRTHTAPSNVESLFVRRHFIMFCCSLGWGWGLPTVLRASWLCIRGSLLPGLGGPYMVRELTPGWPWARQMPYPWFYLSSPIRGHFKAIKPTLCDFRKDMDGSWFCLKDGNFIDTERSFQIKTR